MRIQQELAILTMAAAIIPAAYCPAQTPATETQAEPQVRVIAPEDQPTKEQLARLFDAMQLKQQMAAMMKSLPAMMQQQVSQQIKSMTANMPGGVMTPEQQEALEKLTKKYMDKAFSLYSPDEMIADMASIYQRHLSKEDVEAMISFYGSPAGQHLLQLSPVVMKEYMPMVMSRTQERSKALTDEMMKDLRDMMPNWTPPANAPANR